MSGSKVLFLHGMNSRPYEDRMEIMHATGAKVFAPHIDYSMTDGVDEAIEIIEKEGISHLAGHSLGGIIAYYLSNRYRIPALLFNPAFGKLNTDYFNRVFEERLNFVGPGNSRMPFDYQFAVVGMKDDVVDPFVQLQSLKHATVWKEEELTHKIDPTTFKKYFDKFCALTNKEP